MELNRQGIEMNNEPVAWMYKFGSGKDDWDVGLTKESEQDIPLYTHPAKTQLSNGHLSDCAIHNEPASRNKDCDCGFEPKFDLSGLKHEDNCRYFDDGMFCTCGADNHALVEWYRHKEVTHPADLTDEEINELWLVTCSKAGEVDDMQLHFARAILRKAQEK